MVAPLVLGVHAGQGGSRFVCHVMKALSNVCLLRHKRQHGAHSTEHDPGAHMAVCHL